MANKPTCEEWEQTVKKKDINGVTYLIRLRNREVDHVV